MCVCACPVYVNTGILRYQVNFQELAEYDELEEEDFDPEDFM